MPCSPGVSCETLTAILMPLPVGMIFADPIFVPCAFTISAWAELGAAETNWTAAENHKSPATANRIRKRMAYLTERRFDIGTASILSHAASLQIARLANLYAARGATSWQPSAFRGSRTRSEGTDSQRRRLQQASLSWIAGSPLLGERN